MVEHAIPALEVVFVFITIYLHIFLLKPVRSCERGILTSDRHIDLLLSTEVAFLQSNIGHQNLLNRKKLFTLLSK